MVALTGGPSSLTVIGGWASGRRLLALRGREGPRAGVPGPGLATGGGGDAAVRCRTDRPLRVRRLVGLTVGTDDLFSTGRAVLTALRGIAADEPLVIAVDDVQWLDSFSARVLRYALRRLETEPIAIVSTLRSDGTGSDPLAWSATLPLERQVVIEPEPLGLDDIRRLIGDTTGAVPRPTLRGSIGCRRGIRSTRSNWRAPCERRVGERRAIRSCFPIPCRWRSATDQSHGGDLWPLLEVVSAIGRPSVGSLRKLQMPGDLEELLALAQQERLLVVEENPTVRFSHPIVGSVVYARIDPIARRDLHERLAELATDPDVRARHLALSNDEADEDVAAALEEAAAGRAAGARPTCGGVHRPQFAADPRR